jgi:hypothetical protein
MERHSSARTLVIGLFLLTFALILVAGSPPAYAQNSCAQQPFPECFGDCPTGQTCQGDPASRKCLCAAPRCEESPYPNCGGDCPAGTICRPNAAGLCQCVPLPCDQGPYPQCEGSCPAP